MMTSDSSEWIDYGYLICVIPSMEYSIDDIIWIDPNEYEYNIDNLNQYYKFLKELNKIFYYDLSLFDRYDVYYESQRSNSYISVFNRNIGYELLVEELEQVQNKMIFYPSDNELRKLIPIYTPLEIEYTYVIDCEEEESISFPWFGYLELVLKADKHIKITNHEVDSFVNFVDQASENVFKKLTHQGVFFQLNFEREILGFLGHERSDDKNKRRLDFIKTLRS